MKTLYRSRNPKRPWGIRLVEAELKRAFDNGFKLDSAIGSIHQFYLWQMDPSVCFEGDSIEDCLVQYLGWKARETVHAHRLAEATYRKRKKAKHKPRRRGK